MVTIRNATENDLQPMLDIYNELIQNTTAVFQYDLHTLEQRKEWFAQKQKDNFPVFIAEENNTVVGFSTFGHFRNWQAYKYSVEHSIYVKSGQRNQGIGTFLMLKIINAAKQMDMHTIIAGIDADNDTSIMFHSRFGFQQVAHFKQVGYKFDTWLDLVFMQLIL